MLKHIGALAGEEFGVGLIVGAEGALVDRAKQAIIRLE